MGRVGRGNASFGCGHVRVEVVVTGGSQRATGWVSVKTDHGAATQRSPLT